jgi:hypothetical protein
MYSQRIRRSKSVRTLLLRKNKNDKINYSKNCRDGVRNGGYCYGPYYGNGSSTYRTANQPKSQFVFHENCSPRDLCRMTVATYSMSYTNY